MYICNHGNDVLSRLSPQWLCGKTAAPGIICFKMF